MSMMKRGQHLKKIKNNYRVVEKRWFFKKRLRPNLFFNTITKVPAIFADGWRHLLTEGAVEVKNERFLVVVRCVAFQILHHDLTDLAFQWIGLLFRRFFVLFNTLDRHLQAVHLIGRRGRGRGGAAAAAAATATFSAVAEPQIGANLLRCDMDVLLQGVKYGVHNRVDEQAANVLLDGIWQRFASFSNDDFCSCLARWRFSDFQGQIGNLQT